MLPSQPMNTANNQSCPVVICQRLGPTVNIGADISVHELGYNVQVIQMFKLKMIQLILILNRTFHIPVYLTFHIYLDAKYVQAKYLKLYIHEDLLTFERLTIY